MASVDNLNDLFLETLKDVYYAEKKILKALPKMAKALGKESELAMAFEKHRQETEGQVQRLEEVFAIFGTKPKGKTCDAIEGLVKEADGLMKESGCDCAMAAGLLAGAQAVEHYEIARYGALAAWARLLGHEDAAELLEETLEEEKQTDALLTRMAEDSINQEALDAMDAADDEEEEEEDMPRQRTSRRHAA